jgi:hypothetical protein
VSVNVDGLGPGGSNEPQEKGELPEDSDLAALDSANEGLQKAPALTIQVRCDAQETVSVNAVTPSVTVGEGTGAHHADQFKPALVTLQIAETTGDPAYDGTGTATVATGNATLHDSASCTTALVQPLSATALLLGVPVYVKGGATGVVAVRLTLTDPGLPHLHVVPRDERSVTFLPVNVVTPSVTPLAREGSYHPDQFKPAMVSVKIVESADSPVYDGTGTVTVATGTAALFTTVACSTALPQPLSATALRKGVMFFVKGGAVGPATIRVTLTDPNDPCIRVIPYRDGGLTFLPVNVVTPSVTPTVGEGFLHASQFKAAKVVVQIAESANRPAYPGTGTVTVATGNARLYANEGCTTPLAQPLSAGNLRGGVPVFVRGGALGAVTIRLTLTDPRSTDIRIGPGNDGDVTFLPVNVVTPGVTPVVGEGFHHADQFKPAQVTAQIAESADRPVFAGTGTVTVTSGKATLFSDEGCTTPLAQRLPATDLRKGVPVFVKASATGAVNLRLTLTDPDDRGVRVALQPKDCRVTFSPVNVVTPSVTPSPVEGCYDADQFWPAQVTLRIAENPGKPAYGGTGTATIATGNASLFADAACTTPLPDSFSATALRKGVPVFVKGGALGAATVRLTLTDPGDARLRVVTPKQGVVTFLPVNVITPKVDVDQGEGFYHPDRSHPACATLRIAESAKKPAYAGTGEATVASGNATLFRDPECTKPLLPDLGAAALRKGVPVYVKGGAEGPVTVLLTITDPQEGRFRVRTESSREAFTFSPLNIITPVLGGDELVLVHAGFEAPFDTSLSQLTVSYRESNPRKSCPDLAIKVTYGEEIECFTDIRERNAFESDSTLARARLKAPFPLHVRGVKAGNCKVTATAEGKTDPAWYLVPDVSKDVRVEKLTLNAHKFRDGLTSGPGGAHMAGGNPKRRELHQRDGAAFTFARFVMRRPSPELWTKATRITLSTQAGAVAIFSDEAATVPVAHLAQAAFAGGDVELWVRTTAAPVALTPEPRRGVDLNWGAWAAHDPEKEITPDTVSCGATLVGSNKELVRGDMVTVDTFSLDRTLDRKVRNACGQRVKNPGDANLQRESAISRTAAHHYYDKESRFWANHYYRPDGTSPFKAFMNNLNASAEGRSQRGVEFIERHLRDLHGIRLAPTMKTRIQDYLGVVLGRGHGFADKFGFDKLYGLPGTHAEVLAANELMLAGIVANRITVATYMVQDQEGRRGKRFIACPNCSGILDSTVFRVITG